MEVALLCRKQQLPEKKCSTAMPASMPTRLVAVSCSSLSFSIATSRNRVAKGETSTWEPSLADTSAALPCSAKCWVRAARVAPPATPAKHPVVSRSSQLSRELAERTCDSPGDAAKAGEHQEDAWEGRRQQLQRIAAVVEAVCEETPLLGVRVQPRALQQGWSARADAAAGAPRSHAWQKAKTVLPSIPERSRIRKLNTCTVRVSQSLAADQAASSLLLSPRRWVRRLRRPCPRPSAWPGS